MNWRNIMLISQIKLKNFRGYYGEHIIKINNLTAFIGKNDAGKSTILKALDIFFNNTTTTTKFDKDDINKIAFNNDINKTEISICFKNLPENIIIDDTISTTFKEEYLLNNENELEIVKKYTSDKPKIFIRAYHPTQEKCSNLLNKTQSELRKIIQNNNIECENNAINKIMRQAIWQNYSNELQFNLIDIDVTKNDSKTIWEKIEKMLPIYTLFRADRENKDSDNEVQDPLKTITKEVLMDPNIQNKLQDVAKQVSNSLQEISNAIQNNIKQIEPNILNDLMPNIPSSDSLKWYDVFKNVSMVSDNNIPINKRGSGVKRIILLSFLMAQAERRKISTHNTHIIYAIEEPETSQHTQHQLKLIETLKKLSLDTNSQIIITTHSPRIVKELAYENIIMVTSIDNSRRLINIEKSLLPYPSLNEVNYLAFNEITEEYHDELYGHIYEMKLMKEFLAQYDNNMEYRYPSNINNGKIDKVCLSKYIRDQIHHPENKLNNKYTLEQLEESINRMRLFIQNKNS